MRVLLMDAPVTLFFFPFDSSAFGDRLKELVDISLLSFDSGLELSKKLFLFINFLRVDF